MQTFLNQYSLLIFSGVIVFAIFLFIGLTRIKISWISLGVLFVVVCILTFQIVNRITDSQILDLERIQNAQNSGDPLVLYFYSNLNKFVRRVVSSVLVVQAACWRNDLFILHASVCFGGSLPFQGGPGNVTQNGFRSAFVQSGCAAK